MRLLAVGAVAAILAAGACGGGDSGSPNPPPGLADCVGNAQFSVPVVAVSDLNLIAPLGNLAPTSHVFPTRHIAWYSKNVGGTGALISAQVFAPGSVTISEVLSQHSTNGVFTFDDFTITFYPCKQMQMYFGHVASLSADLAAAVGPLTTNCNTYSTGGFTVTQCRKEVAIPEAAGAVLGTMGGPNEGAMDFGGSDLRTPALAYANPSNFPGGGNAGESLHMICAVDYYTPAVRDQLRTMLGVPSIGHRTVEPLCGQVMQDIAGTAQGRWFFDRTEQEDHHIALVHDSVDPTVIRFSIGSSISTLPPGVYSLTGPIQGSGQANRDFPAVTADGKMYCWDVVGNTNRRILVQMSDATHLRIEGGAVSSTCGSSPSAWAFTSAAADFGR